MLDYESDIKTDLCWAIDTNDLTLLEQAYKAAKQRLGGDKRGRPPLPESRIAQYELVPSFQMTRSGLRIA